VTAGALEGAAPHIAVARWTNAITARMDPPELRDPEDQHLIDELIRPDATGEDRVLLAHAVLGGWLLLAFALELLTAGAGLITRAPAGPTAAAVVVAVPCGAGLGCVAGAVSAVVHRRHGKRAVRLARTHGVGTPALRAELDAAVPGRGTTVAQAVVGVMATGLVAALLL
jgi:hypothetical protein